MPTGPTSHWGPPSLPSLTTLLLACSQAPPWTWSKPALLSTSARRGRACSWDKREPSAISPESGVGMGGPSCHPKDGGSRV